MDALTEPDRAGRAGRAARPPLVRELLLVAGLFLVYKAGRQLATGHTTEALHNAGRVWDLERLLQLPGEGAVQSLMLHGDTVVRVANTYYATVHFPATAAFLVWLYLKRPAHYLWARRVLAAVTAAALVLPFTFPLAPPRMLAATGLVDTARVYGPSVYGPPSSDHLSNQFAAMPSLHFGWALMVAVGMIAATRSRLRTLWLLHPLVTLLVIVGTANHYWLDAIVATVMLGVALALIPGPHRPHRTATPAGSGLRRLVPTARTAEGTAPQPAAASSENGGTRRDDVLVGAAGAAGGPPPGTPIGPGRPVGAGMAVGPGTPVGPGRAVGAGR